MMELWIDIIFKAFWCGCAASGFAVLFNTPSRALLPVFLGGCIGGFLKYFILHFGISGGIILASLVGAAAAGFISVPFSHWRHVPPIIISIPSVIPMIPGSFAYRTILSLIKFIHQTDAETLTKAVYNGTMTLFIVLVLAIGVSLPMLLFRVETTKHLKILKS